MMGKITMRDDGVAAPSGPDEMFRQYYGYVRKIVAGTPAIPWQEAEDVTMEIMTRLCERDVLAMFDPRMKFSHEGKEMPARFRTFLTAQVQLYVKGQRDKLGRQRKRELLVYDQPAEEGVSAWADLFSGAEDDLSSLDAAEFIRQARGFLATVPRRSDRDRCDLVRLFDELVAQVSRTGTANAAETAARLGVSTSVMGRQLAWMRQNLRQQAVLSRRVQVGGEAYMAAHVRQAIAILQGVKSSPGAPFVRQPLLRAGNPLWQMDYHAVARYERATYPECEVPPLHQGKGHYAPHVLTAVAHYLDRVIVPVLSAPA